MTTSDGEGERGLGRSMRRVAACALAALACVAAAVHATVPGTVIQNRANATGQVSGGPVARDSTS